MIASTETTSAPRSLNRRLGLVLAAGLVLLGVAGWSGYTMYRNGRIASFDPACRQALEGKQWKRLNELASAWASWEPDNADAWIYWAEAQQQQGNYEEAARLLKNLPDEHPRTIPALVERTTLLFGPLNRPFEGIETCQRVLELNAQICEVRQRMIFFYALTLQRKRMVEAVHAALASDCDVPENYVYLLGTDWITFSNGYDQNNRWLTSDPENETFLAARAMHFVQSAGLAEKAVPASGTEGGGGIGGQPSSPGRPTSQDQTGDGGQPGQRGEPGANADGGSDSGGLQSADAMPEHERILREYLQRFPQNLELLAYFLNQATSEGDLVAVSELLAQAPGEATDDNRFWRYKGWLHARQDELPLAEQAYREALRLNPYDWVSQHQLADVMRRLQRFEEVERLERLSSQGKELRMAILKLPDARAVPQPLLEQMADYCEGCGQVDVARQLRRRIDGIRLLP